jgi:spermidine/putrescine transport system substrate-binding protein
MAVKKIFAVLLALLTLVLSSFTAASAEEETYTIHVEDESYYQKFQGQNIEINVYNWGEYIANDALGFVDVNQEFEKLTGIKVNYTMFSSNEELYAKMCSGGTSYDVIIPSDYMIGRMIGEGMLQKLDFSNIPNYKYIDEEYKNKNYDPENEYSVPYFWGVVGIIYNKTMIDASEITGWDIFWDEKYADNMLMFANSRDAFAISLLDLGYSFNTTDEGELREAAAHLSEQKPLVQAYVMDEIYDKMEGGEAAFAAYYYGDAISMMSECDDLDFYIPENTSIFVDAFCIPEEAKNKEAAEMYINFMCEPEVGAANSIYVGYSTPMTAAWNLLDEDIHNNKAAYPDPELLEKLDSFATLPRETNGLVDQLWTEIIASDVGSGGWLLILLLGLLIGTSIAVNRVHKSKKSKQ